MSGTPRLTLVPRFSQNTPYDREDILVKLDQLISPKGAHSARSVVLHGIPEIGKTTVAAGYATKKFEYGIYDFVLWVQGQNSVSIAQSFTKIAHRLDLNGADAKSHDHNHYLVQKWLQSQGAPVLIVFDQVKSLESIEPYWPASGRETVIITTHESRLAFKDIEHDILVNRWDNETGSEFLLKQLQKNEHFEADTASAVALSETMGGHPALLTACATYVVEAKISLAEYRNLKPWNNLKTEAARESSTWALIFDQFSEDSQHLMATLCYLDPRIDPSKLLRENGSKNFPYHLDFCNHESEFSDALHKPKALGFIKASQDGGTLVIETSVQTCLRKIFPLECRQKSFNTAAELLVGVFPDRELAESQLYNKWEICNTYLRHVMHLKECFDKEMAISKEFKAPREFCILLEIAQRFLSETNNMKECMNLCQANLRALKRLGQDPEQADFEAAILSHQAQATESLGDPEKAIELNKEVYNIRLKQEQVQKPGNSTAELKTAKTRLAKVANNVGYCCDTANIHEEAKKWFIKSEEIWTSMINDKLEEQPRPARHVANHARCLTYLRNFDEEVESKFKMAIIELQNEDPINQAIALFGRATLLRKQSKFKEAKEQYFGARSAWQKLDGTGFHPFSAACGYRLGTCCLRLEEFRAAISHLEESCEQSKVWKADRPVEHARGLLMLSEALEADSTSTQADRDAHKRDAEALLRNAHIDPMQDNIVDACDDRVPIFWR
ncbi:hypothetical protein QQS21_004920 [Conoideocrella luteorostrata]|uniref:NB-ARC domain-containing protein n=1 Tax=Conoideocrella luteorostrata TaxID=1105319 RepID=A0AAJ0CSX7_9HYPO|nr:hypothetical protein QQS21_004920 [Conoideocrella luteorostrata]